MKLSDPTVGVLISALTRVKPSLPVLLNTPDTGTHEISSIEVQDDAVILYGQSEENAPLKADRTLLRAHLTTVSVILGILQTTPHLWRVAISTPQLALMTAMRQSTLAQTVLLLHTG